MRPVDRFVHHGAPLAFRDLCRAAVPKDTRYLVLDLDRTLHLARNMGELLGWEVAAYRTYGAEHLESVEHSRGPGRTHFTRSRPLTGARYMLRSMRSWAYPGLFYLLWGRMAEASPTTRRVRAQLFGEDAYLYVQTLPRLGLLHDLAGMTLDEARELATRVFRRQAPYQVIERSDLEWLRERCPGVKIILSSASPQPMVEAAARELGIDATFYAGTEVVDGRISAPYQMSPIFLHPRQPHHISPPSACQDNSGLTKVERLVETFPDILEAETVGITDTWHGDDHCWAQHFKRVIDINSLSPFPPLVSVDSPVREIHSAQVLTRGERELREQGEPGYTSPRRKKFASEHACDLDGQQIAQRLGQTARRVDDLADSRVRLEAEISERVGRVASAADKTLSRIEQVVAAYNDAEPSARDRWLEALGKLVRRLNADRRQRARVERPLSELALEYSLALEESRAKVTAVARVASASPG